jgi:hypothetical protein
MARQFGRRQEAGAGVIALLLLLVIAAGAGAWNYRRNAVAEDNDYRPFRGYTDEAIEQLIDAYENQHDDRSQRLDRATSHNVKIQGKGHYDEQIREFERVQRVSRNTRALRDELAESQTSLKLLREEAAKRAAERQKLRIFFKRLLTI